MSDDRGPLGRLVRDTWVAWAMEQPGIKLSWLVTWDQLPEDDPQREVDMRIGEAVAAATRREIAAIRQEGHRGPRRT